MFYLNPLYHTLVLYNLYPITHPSSHLLLTNRKLIHCSPHYHTHLKTHNFWIYSPHSCTLGHTQIHSYYWVVWLRWVWHCDTWWRMRVQLDLVWLYCFVFYGITRRFGSCGLLLAIFSREDVTLRVLWCFMVEYCALITNNL